MLNSHSLAREHLRSNKDKLPLGPLELPTGSFRKRQGRRVAMCFVGRARVLQGQLWLWHIQALQDHNENSGHCGRRIKKPRPLENVAMLRSDSIVLRGPLLDTACDDLAHFQARKAGRRMIGRCMAGGDSVDVSG